MIHGGGEDSLQRSRYWWSQSLSCTLRIIPFFFDFQLTMSSLPAQFEIRSTGSFSVICLKGEAKFAEPVKPKKVAKAAESDDDDVDDLFGDDDEEEEDISDIIAKRIAADKDLQAAIKAKKEKAAKKGAQIQKTMFVYDVKPYDTETDLLALAAELKQQTHPGIICWGEEHKLIDVAFGVKKLRISMIVDDDKACTDDLEELMVADGRDDSIQSVDLVTMSKV